MSAPAVTRSALVALAGPPNAGKSTLLNALIGEKLAIVSPKAQTTRRNLRGAWSGGGCQLVFCDTPGLLQPGNALQQGMRQAALRAVEEADLVLAVASPDTEEAWSLPPGFSFPRAKTMLVINKADAHPKDKVLDCALRLMEKLGAPQVLNVSALKGGGVAELRDMLAGRALPGPPLMEEDALTDSHLRDLAAEAVREKALELLRQELPHSLAVGVDAYKERADGLHEISATIYVERESQKRIVVGAAGSMLKRIGTLARQDMERLAGARVMLKLWVKVAPRWKDDPQFLKEMGLAPAKGAA